MFTPPPPPPPSFQAFRTFEEFQKTVVVQQQQHCSCCNDIPPPYYNHNLRTIHSSLHFHNQMTITNRTIRSQYHPLSNIPTNTSSRLWPAEPKLENVSAAPTRSTQLQGDTSSSLIRQQRFHGPHDYCSAAAAFPETEKKHNIQSHDENPMGGVSSGGGGGNGAGLVEEDLFNLMDASFDGSSESEDTRKSSHHHHHNHYHHKQQQRLAAHQNTSTVDVLSPAAKRHRRMIKNRESAARSRARKQAYTTQLEIEVAKLRKENELLRKAKKFPDEHAVAEQQSQVPVPVPSAGPSQQHSKMLGDQLATNIDYDPKEKRRYKLLEVDD